MSVAGEMCRLHALSLSAGLPSCLATASLMAPPSPTHQTKKYDKASNDGNRIATALGCSAGTALLNAKARPNPSESLSRAAKNVLFF
ncbi:hypothetical protein AOQ84DRAFT_91965 [Glonium stellatum]|uniref:Secreted protein n=1 Tax=Glonium stellatum TaxID=574774 RepID=A0A8E2EVV3_9PEZI|nr:hypothetical protein AOQ84DRAFT_91965 [Glonium stellatum]